MQGRAVISTPAVETLSDAVRTSSNAKSMRARPLPGSEEAMTTFDKREEGFEKQFAHDEELRFKATARRNKLLGLWAAQKLGLSGAEAEAYAKEVVVVDLEEPGEDDVFRKIRGDFDAKGVKDSDHQIRRTMTELMAQSIEAIKAGR
jgi:hypothetical protein